MATKLSKAEIKIQFPELYEKRRASDQARAQQRRDEKKEKLVDGTATEAELANWARADAMAR